MEYSVGSIAALISGISTPNKTKVIKKEFKKEKSNEENSPDLQKNNSKTKSIKQKTISPIKKILKKKGAKQTSAELGNDDVDLIHSSSKKLRTGKDRNNSKSTLIKQKTVNSIKKTLEKNGIKRTSEMISNDDDDDIHSPPKKQKTEDKLLTGNKVKPFKKNGQKGIFIEKASPFKKNGTTYISQVEKPKISKNEQNALSRIKSKLNKEIKTSGEYVDRTVFVGNIPINVKKGKIKKYFKKYGPIETVRIRGIPVQDPKTPKRVAAIKKEFHPDRNTLYAFIRFVNSEDAKKTEAENGQLFEEHHLRVHCCESSKKHDESKAIFIGNLSFDAEEEELWNLFSSCGPISYVRIVRDGQTGMGKGFGYVNFKDSDSVQLALEMEKVMFKNRELRISLCNLAKAKKNTHNSSKIKMRKPKIKEEGTSEDNNITFVKKEHNNQFSGSKFTDKKKKKKFNKGAKDKKKLAEKLTGVKTKKQH